VAQKEFGLPISVGLLHHMHSPAQSYYCSPRALWAAGCLAWPKSHFLRQPGHPGFPQSVHVDAELSADAGSTWLLSSNHPQILASHLLGLQGPQQTPACRISSKLEYLTVCCCCVPTPITKVSCVHTNVPTSDEKVGSLQDLILWEICQGYDQQSQDKELQGLLWPKKKLMM
jgi:hypothetical protein